MELANIFPIKNQSFYKREYYVMLLAHLINQYNPKYFSNNQYIILDNGLYEGAQVSTNLKDIIKIAEKSELPISEIIIPDSFFDARKTIELFKKSIPTIKRYSDKYNFMFVAQSKNIEEFEKVIDYMNQYADYLPLVIGVPKRAPFKRECSRAINIYKKCLYPIHFLGLTDTTPLINLYKVADIVRSCDTSQICTYLKNKKNTRRSLLRYFRKAGRDSIIDLENDCLVESDIEEELQGLKDAGLRS